MKRIPLLLLLTLRQERFLASSDGAPCYGYITGSSSFLRNTDPAPIECGSSAFGDGWGPEEHQELSCCSGNGRYFVSTGQIGGFDVAFDSSSEFYNYYPATCIAYSDALQAVLCDPRQGKYISNNILRICRSSCDAVFDACGPPGEVFPRWANYSDGTSLCHDTWGFFGSSPCESRPDGFPCQVGLNIEVVDSDCLSIVEPSDRVVKHYEEEQFSPNPCSDDKGIKGGAIVGIIVGVTAAIICACVGLCLYLRRRSAYKQSEASGTIMELSNATGGRVDEEISVPVPSDIKKQQPSPAIAVATPIPAKQYRQSNPSALPSVYPSAPPEEMAQSTVTPVIPVAVIESKSQQYTAPVQQQGALYLMEQVEQAETHEKSQVIRSWLREHPTEAAAFSPNEVADVLSKVTFSLDQTDAAAELAAGMGSSLICAHVGAVLGQCKGMNAVDIAKVMVPYVTDPQNKDMVLQEIRFVFERDEVSRRFPKVTEEDSNSCLDAEQVLATSTKLVTKTPQLTQHHGRTPSTGM